jgi:membrane protein implicated in regulation of membrane protease activity
VLSFQPFQITLVIALGVLLIEIVTRAFVFLSFSVGLLAVSLVEYATSSYHIAIDAVIFALVSLLTFVAIRAHFKGNNDTKTSDKDVNEY